MFIVRGRRSHRAWVFRTPREVADFLRDKHAALYEVFLASPVRNLNPATIRETLTDLTSI